jgi:flagellar basal-body rod protein FlgC
MSGSALNIGLTSLRAYQRALDSSSHNIANANTSSFQTEQAQFQETPAGGVVVNISQNGSVASGSIAPTDLATQSSGTDLATELVNSIQYKSGVEFSAQIVKAADQVLGTLIDIQA